MNSGISNIKLIVLLDELKVSECNLYLIKKLSKLKGIKSISILKIGKNQKKKDQIEAFLGVAFTTLFKLEEKKFSKVFEAVDINDSTNHIFNIQGVQQLNNYIEEEEPELILDISSNLISSSIMHDIKYGIMYYKTSLLDNKLNHLYGFWELMLNKGEIFGELLLKRNGEKVSLSKTYSYVHKFSVYKSLINHNWKITEHIFIEIKRFVDNDFKYINTSVPNEKVYLSTFKQILLAFLLPFFYVRIIWGGLMKRIVKKKWILLYNKVENIDNLLDIQFDEFKKISFPLKNEQADPFVIKNNDNIYIFYEEIIPSGKGHLSCSLLDTNKNNLTTHTEILNTDYHLSFPNILKYKDEFYMIPESQANNRIMLFKCEEFPSKWKWEKNLFENIYASDSEVIFKDGYWWLFTCIRNERMIYNNDDLYLFYADDLFGKWHPHPLNPVVSDVKRARGAGKIIKNGNRLIRPSQNCKYTYGYGLNLNEIRVLSTTEYKEELLKVYEFEHTKLKNLHTINLCDNYIFVDAKD